MNKRILAAVLAAFCLLSLTSCFGQVGGNSAPTAIAITPPSESEIISYFSHFNIDILSAEQAYTHTSEAECTGISLKL